MQESSLALKIKALRRMRNWTQAELATQAHISRSYVSELERGTREPTVGIIKNIADALEAPIDVFFDNVRTLNSEVIIPMLPPEIRAFIAQPESLEYIRIALKAKNLCINKVILSDIVDAIGKGKQK
ncbi:MAG: transcriptional regulator XRE family [Bacillota bacterium]|nr:MAG: transcriptional regulator XRE family [Bacillota bacterium]MBS3950766.1 helix-turn-helix domain-containing protein [Peptococcaceae bacterium]